MDESTLVSLGGVCALRWVEVFKSDCMTQNDSEDSLLILGLILQELDEGFLVFLSLSSSGERERSVTSWIWIRFSEEAEQKTGFVLRVHGVQLKC